MVEHMKDKIITALLIFGLILLGLGTYISISSKVDSNEFQSTEINTKIVGNNG